MELKLNLAREYRVALESALQKKQELYDRSQAEMNGHLEGRIESLEHYWTEKFIEADVTAANKLKELDSSYKTLFERGFDEDAKARDELEALGRKVNEGLLGSSIRLEEARNTPFCVSQEKFHTAVLQGVRIISEAP